MSGRCSRPARFFVTQPPARLRIAWVPNHNHIEFGRVRAQSMQRDSRGRPSGDGSEGPADAGRRLFAEYETRPAFYDEMFEASGVPRIALPAALRGARRDAPGRNRRHAGVRRALLPASGDHLRGLRRGRRAGADHPHRLPAAARRRRRLGPGGAGPAAAAGGAEPLPRRCLRAGADPRGRGGAGGPGAGLPAVPGRDAGPGGAPRRLRRALRHRHRAHQRRLRGAGGQPAGALRRLLHAGQPALR